MVQNRKVTLKNLDLDAMPLPGAGTGSGSPGSYPAGSTGPRLLQMHGRDRHGSVGRLAIACGNVPADAVVVAAIDKEARRTFRVADGKLTPRAQKVRESFAAVRNHPRELGSLNLKALVAREVRKGEVVTIGEAVIATGKPVEVAVWMHSRKWNPDETYTFDIVQVMGRQVTGGYTVTLTNVDKTTERK